jgi:hypothetical protein
MKKLLLIRAAVLTASHAVVGADAPVPQIWFSLGGQGNPPETNKSWDIQNRLETHVGTKGEIAKSPYFIGLLMVGAQGIEPWTSPV